MLLINNTYIEKLADYPVTITLKEIVLHRKTSTMSLVRDERRLKDWAIWYGYSFFKD